MGSRVQVEIESGIVEGSICDNEVDFGKKYFSFQGIPYAKAPIGENRFKGPQPVEPWKGIKDATVEGEQCFSKHMFFNTKFGSEDCLNLNVFTTKLPLENTDNIRYDLKPVMVFIHGGAFTAGSNSKQVYGPEYLLREDVLLVAINYRLGLLGFLSLEDSTLGVPGNAGFKDMIMALKWVQKNIKHFNGDPNDVTIFGESAGSVSVHLLMLSPLAKGLFHKAIAQSGTALNVWAPSMKVAPRLAKILGMDGSNDRQLLQKLREMTVEELHKAQCKLPDKWHVSDMRPVGFSIENPDQTEEPFLSEDPLKLIQMGKYNHVPLLLGYNSREGMLIHAFSQTKIQELIPDIEYNVPYVLGLKKKSSTSKQIAQKIMKFYFGDQDPDKADIDLHYQLVSDNFFIRDIIRTALAHSKSMLKPTFLYEMTIETSMNIFKKFTGIESPGVCHADDIPYLFKTFSSVDVQPNTPEDIGIRRFCKLWTNFAKYGNPNSPTEDSLLPAVWKSFTPRDKYYLEIGQEIVSRKEPLYERMRFWDEIYSYKNVNHKL